jgi:hypothetical protein
MIIKRILWGLSVGVCLPALAGEASVNEVSFYKGEVGSSPVRMSLRVSNGVVSGRYIYDKYNTPILLSGEIKLGGVFLREGDAKKFSLLQKGESLNGVWSDGVSIYAVNLREEGESYKDIIECISGSTEKLIIKFRSGMVQEIPISIAEDSLNLIFEDFNFDGFPDLRVLAAGGISNSTYLYYEYDPAGRRFVQSSNRMDEVNNPKVMHARKIVAGLSREGCCSYKIILIGKNSELTAAYDYSKNSGYKVYATHGEKKGIREGISRSYFEKNFMEVYESNVP